MGPPSAHAASTAGAVPTWGPLDRVTVAEPRDRESGERRRRWVLPTVIAVVASRFSGASGVVIGLLVHGVDRAQAADPARAFSGRPPMVTGSDLSSMHQSCDLGFTLPNATGYGTHAGGGLPKRRVFSPTAC